MAKDLDFIKNERNTIGKTYTNIAYAINEISPFIEEKDLKKRRYYTRIDILKKYIDLLDSTEVEAKKKSFANKFKSNDRIRELKNYKQKNSEVFNQLENCSNCQCLSCSFECKFKGCSGCKNSSFLKACDKEKLNVRVYDSFNLDLTNNNTGKTSKYKVLATVENCELDKLYILLENLYDSGDKLILYYYPGLSSDDFGEITNQEEFDLVVQAYQQMDY